jgi:surface antigen
MQYTIVEYNCYSVLETSGKTTYKIDAVVADAGELPYAAVFVYNIVKADRISSDTFARVASAHDMQLLVPDRHQAVDAGQTQYLSGTVSLAYPSIDIAAQAKVQLTARINDLAQGWITYNTAFQSTSESHIFPNGTNVVSESLTQAYTDAVVARKNATTTLSTATVAVTDAQKDLNYAQLMVEAWSYSVSFLKTASSSDSDRGFVALLNRYHAVIEAEGDAAATLWQTDPGTVKGDILAYQTYCESQKTYWQNQRTVYKTNYTSAIDSKIEAERGLKDAENAEAEAKADILAICPGFDFTTVA